MMFNFDEPIDRRGTSSLKWSRYADENVIPMWVADTDFRVAPAISEAILEQVDHGVFGYPIPPPELKSVIVDHLMSSYNWEVKESWIIWLPGLVSGLNIACRAVGESGNDVLTTAPIYPPFLTAPGNGGRNCLHVNLRQESERWRLATEDMHAAITPETNLFLHCSPHNPTGRVWSHQELTDVAAVCIDHDLVICSDEIHCDLLLDDVAHIPLASLGPEVADRTITLMAPSKSYNIPGLGCSFAIISNNTLRRAFVRELRGIVGDVNSIGFTACLAAYRHGAPWLGELLDYLRGNRDLLERYVKTEIEGLSMGHVEATYLAWIDTRDTGIKFATTFFEEHGVGLSDGRHFGLEGFARLNFGCPRATLETALKRMQDALHSR